MSNNNKLSKQEIAEINEKMARMMRTGKGRPTAWH